MIGRKTIISLMLIIIIVFSSLVLISSSKKYLYFEQLTAETVLLQNGQYAGGYIGNFTDSSMNVVAQVQFFFQNSFLKLPENEVILLIKHEANVDVDSMTVNFKSPSIMSIYLKSDPSNVAYSFDRELDSINFKVEDFRWFGKTKGDAEFHLILQNMQDKSNALQLTFDLSLHREAPIQLAGIKAHSSVNMLIPNGEKID